MNFDPRDILLAQRPDQAQVQEIRRRTNDGPAIADAQDQADLARTLPPVGSSMRWWGTADPADKMFLLEDGRLLTSEAYPELFAVLGVTFNTGGETTGEFRIPDTRGRTGVGAGASPDAALTDRVLGAKWGVENVVLGATQVPNHGHTASSGTESGHNHGANTGSDGIHDHGGTDTQAGHSHTTNFEMANTTGTAGSGNRLVQGPANELTKTSSTSAGHSHALGNSASHNHSISTDGSHSHTITVAATTGGGLSHDNLPPSIAVNYIIRVAA